MNLSQLAVAKNVKLFIILGACVLLSLTGCFGRYTKNLTATSVTDIGENPQGRYLVEVKSSDELGRVYETFYFRTDEKFEAGDRIKFARQ